MNNEGHQYEGHIQILKLHLAFFSPEDVIPHHIKTTRDIYENRSFLKTLPYSDFTLSYLAKIILDDLENNKRFRKNDCIKVLRRIIINFDGDPQLQSETIKLLFSIYKKLIFIVSETNQWYLSRIIKDQKLDESDIKWLIENSDESVHLLNRLLRYPTYHPMICKWAEKVYQDNKYKDRESEIIALLILDDIPPYIEIENCNQILWAIYYSRTSLDMKERLLINYFSPECFKSALEISLRLNLRSVIDEMIKKLSTKAEM